MPVAKIITLLLSVLTYSYQVEMKKVILQTMVICENMSFVFFYLAASLNLFKW